MSRYFPPCPRVLKGSAVGLLSTVLAVMAAVPSPAQDGVLCVIDGGGQVAFVPGGAMESEAYRVIESAVAGQSVTEHGLLLRDIPTGDGARLEIVCPRVRDGLARLTCREARLDRAPDYSTGEETIAADQSGMMATVESWCADR